MQHISRRSNTTFAHSTRTSPIDSSRVDLLPLLSRPQKFPLPQLLYSHHDATDPRGGKLVYDVESAGTAPEQRAPYGDSYDINRLERPFSQEMVYLPALDIVTFIVTKDNDWWYVSIELSSTDPNNMPDANYGVELDLDHDGFGDYLIWSHPPYTNQWDTIPVQIYQDQNHNTGGYSAGKSGAPFSADGYETLVFDGSVNGSGLRHARARQSGFAGHGAVLQEVLVCRICSCWRDRRCWFERSQNWITWIAFPKRSWFTREGESVLPAQDSLSCR
jgi:hypothetical protein